jgi:hypothetical protein
MLDFFAEPRSCTEVTDLIREISGVTQLDANYFAPLVNAGILVTHQQPALLRNGKDA